MWRTCSASARASSVGTRPFTARENKGVPSARSRASMRWRTVGWVRPRRRAAADRLPASMTARKARWSSQLRSEPLMDFQ